MIPTLLILYSILLFSTLLSLLYSFLLSSPLLSSPHLTSPLLSSTLLYSTLYYTVLTIPYYTTLHFFTLYFIILSIPFGQVITGSDERPLISRFIVPDVMFVHGDETSHTHIESTASPRAAGPGTQLVIFANCIRVLQSLSVLS